MPSGHLHQIDSPVAGDLPEDGGPDVYIKVKSSCDEGIEGVVTAVATQDAEDRFEELFSNRLKEH